MFKRVLLTLSMAHLTMFCFAQTVVFSEDFSGYPNQTTQMPGLWTTVANDSDDPGVNQGTNFWGTYNGRFRCNDIEGLNNNDQNFLTTKFFDISSFSKVSVYGDYDHSGGTECQPIPYGIDIIRFTYSTDGGNTWILFDNDGFICGDNQTPGTSSSHCIVGDSIALRVQISNKANSENSYVDNLIIEGYNPPPVIFPEDTSVCNADTIPLSVINGTNYLWSGADSFSCSTCQSTLAYVSENQYVYVTVDDSAGCPNSDSVFISSFVPSIDLGEDTVICNGQSILLNASTISANGWLWSTGETDDTISISSGGKYWVEVNSACGVLSDTIMIDSTRYPDASLGSDTIICYSPWSYSLQPKFGNDFLWNTGDTTSQIIIHSEGTYTVEASTVCGFDRDTVTIDAQLPPSLSLPSDTTICANQELTLQAYANEATYNWSNGQNTSVVRLSEPGTYSVTTTNKCGVDTSYTKLSVRELPYVDIPDTSVICGTDSIVFDAQNPGYSYYWSTGSRSRYATIKETGFYSVEVEGCNEVFIDDFHVEIETSATDAESDLSNVFTPNGDGIIDAYYINGLNPQLIESFEVQIANRWGEVVFESSEPDFKWEGDGNNGNSVPAGTYFMIANYKDACSNGITKTLKKSITLMK